MCGNSDKNCWHCVHADLYDGDFLTWGDYSCMIWKGLTDEQINALDVVNWDCVESPKICGRHQERIVDNCEYCNQNMQTKEDGCMFAELEDVIKLYKYVYNIVPEDALKKKYSESTEDLLLKRKMKKICLECLSEIRRNRLALDSPS